MIFVIEVDNDGFKVYDSGGTLIDPSTEGTLQSVLTKLTEVDTAIDSIDGKVATDTVLQAVRDRIGDISATPTANTLQDRLKNVLATLDSIKDTDGIKKITDQLPAGTNEIGKVAQGTKAAAADGWPFVLYDASGNPIPVTPNVTIPASNKAFLVTGEDAAGAARILQTETGGELKGVLYNSAGNAIGVVLDDTLYRLQTDSKVAVGNDSDDLVHLEALDTVAGQGRLKATIYTPDGDPVAFGAVSASIKNDYVKNGTASSLLVDGSTTPVVFTYLADSTYDISLQELRFTMVANGITFGNGYFGATAGPLTNGTLVEIISDGSTISVFNLQMNEHFINFASPAGWEWIVSNKDVMTSAYLIGGGVKLHAGTGDLVRVTVRDDIDSAGLYFECFVKGNLLTNV